MLSTGILCAILLAVLFLVYLLRAAQGVGATMFRLTVLFAFLWVASILATEQDADRVVLWSRLSFLFPSLITGAILSFAATFGQSLTARAALAKHPWLCALIGTNLLMGLVAATTSLVVVDVVQLSSTFGPLHWLTGVILLASYIYVALFLSRREKHTSARIARQLGTIKWGVVTSATIGVITNVVVPSVGLGEIRFLGPLALIFFLGASTYAIIAQRLFDIRVVIRTTVIFGGLLLFVGALYGTTTVLLLNQLHLGDNQLVSFIVNVAALITVGITFEPIRNRLAEWTDRWLYQKEVTQQSLLSELTRQLNESNSLDSGLDGILNTAIKALRLHHAVAYAYEPTGTRGHQVKRLRQVGYSVGDGKLMLDPNDVVIRYFTNHANTALMRDLEVSLGWEEALLKRGGENATTELVREHAAKTSVTKRVHLLDAVAAVPLHHGNEPLGLILLGPKLSGDGYTSDDVAFLELLAGQAVLAIQKARLIEGDQQKTEFVSIASHELLTPITAIEGYLSMVLDEGLGQVDDKARTYLEKVYSSAQRLSTLIKDLLNISRLESGRLRVEVAPTDIAKMLEEGIDQYQVLAEEKGLALSLKLPKNLPMASVDPLRTGEVINNLVGNAIKYTLHGSVTVSAKVSGKDLLVTVKDTGLGMSKQEMGRLFEKFYRVDNPNRAQIQGTGLGLYITKQIVERMGGTITVESKPGLGSTFSVILPKA